MTEGITGATKLEGEEEIHTAAGMARRMLWFGAVLGTSSLVALVFAAAYPISRRPGSGSAGRDDWLQLAAPSERQDDVALIDRLARRRLIRPSQAVAAVKDTGSASRLLKQLKLLGVAQTGQELVAYVEVADEGVKTLRAGDSVLSFAVQQVKPSEVALSLEGVNVVLRH